MEETNLSAILIAEDEPKLREIYTEELEDDGHIIITADNGKSALQILKKVEKIDLIIVDIKMPQMNGIELIEKIREINNNVPIIICSAYEGLKTDFTIVTSDIVEFLIKPVDINYLSKRVAEILVINKN